MKRTFLLLAACLTMGSIVAQHNPVNDPNLNQEQKEVMATIMELFDGYRASDSSRVRASFTDNAVLMRVGNDQGKPVLRGGSIDGFVNYVGSGLTQLHDEPIWDYVVHIDGNLSTVWTKYAFYLDGEFHHCGVDSFQLFKSEKGWKIFFLSDTSQMEGCEIPEQVRKNSAK